MAKVGGPGLWETRLKEKHPMLRYFSDRPFGVEIEIFGLKYSITAGDRQVIPPYQIMNRTRDGRRLPQVFQDQDLVLNGFSPDEPAYQAWTCVLDDTIKGAGGSELVSPVLSGLPGLA